MVYKRKLPEMNNELLETGCLSINRILKVQSKTETQINLKSASLDRTVDFINKMNEEWKDVFNRLRSEEIALV